MGKKRKQKKKNINKLTLGQKKSEKKNQKKGKKTIKKSKKNKNKKTKKEKRRQTKNVTYMYSVLAASVQSRNQSKLPT